MDAFAATFSAIQAYMLFAGHRRFIGCEVDPSCFSETNPQLILLYARQVLSKKFDIYGEEDVRRPARV